MEEPESPIHLFDSCTRTNFLWTQLQHSLQDVLIIPPITPRSDNCGFTDHKVNYFLINQILLIFYLYFKYYVYKTREYGSLNFKVLKRKFIKNTEKQITLKNLEKRKKIEQKWKPLIENTEGIFRNIWWCDSWVGVGIM